MDQAPPFEAADSSPAREDRRADVLRRIDEAADVLAEKPAHTHFVDLVEPLPPILPNHWELGLSDLGETTDLH